MSDQDVWAAWRAEVEDWHPFPTGFICVAYLATEAGEALDTAIRLLIPEHDRTHDHRRNLGRELAQIADMTNAAAIRYGINLEAECRAWRDEVRDRGPQED